MAIGGTFGGNTRNFDPLLLLLQLLQQWAEEEAEDGHREGTDTASEGFTEGTDAARGMYRGRESGTLEMQ